MNRTRSILIKYPSGYIDLYQPCCISGAAGARIAGSRLTPPETLVRLAGFADARRQRDLLGQHLRVHALTLRLAAVGKWLRSNRASALGRLWSPNISTTCDC